MVTYHLKLNGHLVVLEPITPNTEKLQTCDRNGKTIKREYQKRQPAKWLYENGTEVSQELLATTLTKTKRTSINPYYLLDGKVVRGSSGRTEIIKEFIGSEKKIDLSNYLIDLYYFIECDTLKAEMKRNKINTITFYYFASKGTGERQAFITLKADVLIMYCVKLNSNKKPQKISDFIKEKMTLQEKQLQELQTKDDGIEQMTTSLNKITL